MITEQLINISLPRSNSRHLARGTGHRADLKHSFWSCLTYTVVLTLALIVSLHVSAEVVNNKSCESEYAECAPVGKWEFALGVGVGLRTNPLHSSDDLPIILLPSVSYYGERFFLENLRAGFTLFDDQRSHMMNAVVTVGFEQIYFETVGVGNFFLDDGSAAAPVSEGVTGGGDGGVSTGGDMGGATTGGDTGGTTTGGDTGGADGGVASPIQPNPDPTLVMSPGLSEIDIDDIEERKTAGLVGLEYQYNIRNFALNLQALADATKVHSGYEGRWSISYPFSAGKNDFGIALGGIWQSSKLLNYYYGVSAQDIDAEEPLYTISEGDMSAFLRLDWRREISKNWSLKATMQGKSLSRNIKNSPLVEDDAALTAFFGGVYRF